MVRISGPAIGTRAILVTLSEAAGTEMGWRNFTGDGGALVLGGPVDRLGNRAVAFAAWEGGGLWVCSWVRKEVESMVRSNLIVPRDK